MRVKDEGKYLLLKQKYYLWCHLPAAQLTETFSEILGRQSRSGVAPEKQICVLGDFNIDLLKAQSESYYSHDLLLTLQSCYLIPTVDKPTRL